MFITKRFSTINVNHLLLASNKVVTASTSVGDERIEVAISVKDDTISSRAASSVHLEGGQNGELVPRGGGGELETLVVVVLVRIAVCRLMGLIALYE